MRQQHEQGFDEAFVPQTPVKALGEVVLHRRDWCDVMPATAARWRDNSAYPQCGQA
jgi:hypothetical protein